MKKFFLNYWVQLGLAVVIAFIVSFGFTYFIKDWTRSDVISICAAVVLIWQVGISRWVSIPARELSVIQLDRQKREEKERREPRVSFEYVRSEYGRGEYTAPGFNVRNSGQVDIEDLKIEPLMPTLNKDTQANILSLWSSPKRLSVGSSSFVQLRIGQGAIVKITVVASVAGRQFDSWDQDFTRG